MPEVYAFIYSVNISPAKCTRLKQIYFCKFNRAGFTVFNRVTFRCYVGKDSFFKINVSKKNEPSDVCVVNSARVSQNGQVYVFGSTLTIRWAKGLFSVGSNTGVKNIGMSVPLMQLLNSSLVLS